MSRPLRPFALRARPAPHAEPAAPAAPSAVGSPLQPPSADQPVASVGAAGTVPDSGGSVGSDEETVAADLVAQFPLFFSPSPSAAAQATTANQSAVTATTGVGAVSRTDIASGVAVATAAGGGAAGPAQTERPLHPHAGHSAAQRCHNDALHCIFAFLGLKDWLAVLQSCRQWRAAGGKGPPRGLAISIFARSVASVCASALRRHVADVALHHIDDAVGFDQLRLLAALPLITALNANVDGADVEARLQSAASTAVGAGDLRELRAEAFRIILPPRLRRLSVRLTLSEASTQALVDALPVLADLRSLSFFTATTDADLSSLLQLPLLSEIRFCDPPSLAQCAVVKQLGALTALRVAFPYWHKDALPELVRPPFALQRLEEVSLGQYQCVDPPLMAALLRLPALTALRPGSVAPECWADLPAFTRLRVLRLSWPRVITAEQSAALDSALAALPLLSDVELEVPFVLPRALRLPVLRHLRLVLVSLPSFGFLQHSALLESLLLVRCGQMSAGDLLGALAVHPPARLAELRLEECAGLGGIEQSRLRAALDPPSAMLPQLRSFYYSDPDDTWFR